MRFQLPDGRPFELPDEWWRVSGMQTFVRTSPHYILKPCEREGWMSPTIVSLSDIQPIVRNGPQFDHFGMDRARMVDILTGIATLAPIPAIQIKPCTNSYRFTLYYGLHRYYASIAAGFPAIPARVPES